MLFYTMFLFLWIQKRNQRVILACVWHVSFQNILSFTVNYYGFFFPKYLESDVKENLPDYKKEIHRSTELKLSALTSKKSEKKLNPPMQSISPLASSLPENDYTSEVHLLSTSTSDDHPSGTAVVESWEEVEEVIHKRWKHKHWLSLPGESHLPEQWQFLMSWVSLSIWPMNLNPICNMPIYFFNLYLHFTLYVLLCLIFHQIKYQTR